MVIADLERARRRRPGRLQRIRWRFLCAEYGVHVSLPVYSGRARRAGRRPAQGGVRPGAAARRGRPHVPQGLLPPADRRLRLAARVLDRDRPRRGFRPRWSPARTATPLTVTVPIGEGDVTARIWRVDVGRVPLFLLDTDCPENGPLERWITGRLYDGDPQTRLAQYALLGVGGVRALRAMGYEPGVIHLNEGHAALAPLELARGDATATARWSAALERARDAHRVHHPHAGAGRQRHLSRASEIETAARPPGGRAGRLDRGAGRARRATARADPAAPFGVTQAALRMSRASNAVSRRHGEVAREMWHSAVARSRVDRGADRPRHQRRARADLDRARRCASCSTATCPRTGVERADDPAVWAAVRGHPGDRAVGGAAPPASRAGRVRGRPQRRRPAGARRRARLRRRRRPRV